MNEEINPFEFIKPTEVQIEQMNTLRDKFSYIYEMVKFLPPSREKSLAITNLEQASMWMNRALVLNKD